MRSLLYSTLLVLLLLLLLHHYNSWYMANTSNCQLLCCIVLCSVVRSFVRCDHHKPPKRQTQGGHVTESSRLHLYCSHKGKKRKEKKKTAQRCMQQTRNCSKSNNSKRIVGFLLWFWVLNFGFSAFCCNFFFVLARRCRKKLRSLSLPLFFSVLFALLLLLPALFLYIYI